MARNNPADLRRPEAGHRPQSQAMAINRLLHMFVRGTSRKEYLDSAVDLLASLSGCRCVGIRALDDRGEIPYEAAVGFSEEFLRSECWLSVHSDQCACTRVIRGAAEPQDRAAMTPRGSFLCNRLSAFAAALSPEERSRYRGVCMRRGFETVAIVPLRYGDRVIGAIHLADRRPHRLPAETMDLLESLAPVVGEAAYRFAMEEALERANRALRVLSQFNQAMVRTGSESDLLQAACRILVQVGGYRAARVYLAAEGMPAAWYTDLPEDIETVGGKTAAEALRTGRSQIRRAVRHEGEAGPWRRGWNGGEYDSWIGVPVRGEDGVVGALGICTAEAHAFEPHEVGLLEELADDLAYGLASLRVRAERDRAHRALESERRRLFCLLEAIPGLVYLAGPDFSIRYANRAFREVVGTPGGRPCYQVLYGRDTPCQDCPARRVLETGRPEDGDRVMAGGRVFHLFCYPSTDVDGSPLALLVGMEVTERRRLEREMARLSDRERRRVGQMLHDVLGQNLTGLAFLSEALADRLERGGRAEAAEARKVTAIARQAIRMTRSLARGLAPVHVEAEGLTAALEELAADVEEVYGVRCRLAGSRSGPVPAAVAEQLYYIAHEAVHNAARHGRPRTVTLTLADRDGRLTLIVEDDGVGLPEERRGRGMGLRLMRHRADSIGASLRIEGGPTCGTRVVCTLPGESTEGGGAHGATQPDQGAQDADSAG